jgi:hypothetical protein
VGPENERRKEIENHPAKESTTTLIYIRKALHMTTEVLCSACEESEHGKWERGKETETFVLWDSQ